LEGQKELEIARYYWRAGRKHAAGYYYKRVINNWPETSYAKSARAELLRRLPGEAGK
jgi:outer membrane protein assembly factor BamD (BamD/ComL family)